VHGWRVSMRVSVREDMHGGLHMRFAWVCMLTSVYASVDARELIWRLHTP